MDLELFKKTLVRLYHRGFEKEKIQKLYNYLVQLNEKQLLRIYPNYLAIKLDFNFEETLKLVTYGVVDGLFEMQWQVSCPQCHTLNLQTNTIKNLPLHEHCPACGSDYEPEGDHNVQVVLAAHPRFFNDVLKETDTDMVKIDPRLKPLTLLELMGYPDFQEHFSAQVPRLNQGIKIRSVSIMFTDLISSTRMYEKIGDVQAFLLVNEHFEILFNTIIKKYGGVIKTIGDAVMAVFKDPKLALEAALEIKHSVDQFLKRRLPKFPSGIKIALHVGPAIVVNLNDKFDLFGSTVNKSARLVSLAKSQAIVTSHDFFQHTKHLLKQYNLVKLSKQDVFLKGLNDKEEVYFLYTQPE